MSLDVYLGIDVGSVTTKLALVDEKGKYVDSYMLKTAGKPVDAVQNGLKQIVSQAICDYSVKGVGTTGSGRNLAGALVGADVVKNEITAHAVAASTNIPGVQTILEIMLDHVLFKLLQSLKKNKRMFLELMSSCKMITKRHKKKCLFQLMHIVLEMIY